MIKRLPTYNEMMGIKENKRKPIPKPIKDEVLVRQNYKCAECGRQLPARKHFHHDTPISEGGTNSVSNLYALCPGCHAQLHHDRDLKEAEEKQEKPKDPTKPDWSLPDNYRLFK